MAWNGTGRPMNRRVPRRRAMSVQGWSMLDRLARRRRAPISAASRADRRGGDAGAGGHRLGRVFRVEIRSASSWNDGIARGRRPSVEACRPAPASRLGRAQARRGSAARSRRPAAAAVARRAAKQAVPGRAAASSIDQPARRWCSARDSRRRSCRPRSSSWISARTSSAVGAGADADPVVGDRRIAGAHRIDRDEAGAARLELARCRSSAGWSHGPRRRRTSRTAWCAPSRARRTPRTQPPIV